MQPIQEPWYYTSDRETLPFEIFTDTGDADTQERIAVICGRKSAKTEARARRITACVNACEGIDTSARTLKVSPHPCTCDDSFEIFGSAPPLDIFAKTKRNSLACAFMEMILFCWSHADHSCDASPAFSKAQAVTPQSTPRARKGVNRERRIPTRQERPQNDFGCV